MRYKFEQFNVEIVDPTMVVSSVLDRVDSQTCSVDIVLKDEVDSKFGITLEGFEYSSKGTWEDSDILNWVKVELTNYEVNPQRQSQENINTTYVSTKLKWYQKIINFFKI